MNLISWRIFQMSIFTLHYKHEVEKYKQKLTYKVSIPAHSFPSSYWPIL